MGSFELFAVGNINLDITFKLPRMPSLDENIRSNETWIGTGGSAVNYSIAVKNLGYPIYLVAKAGRDAERLGLLEFLQNAGINVSKVSKSDQMDTGKVVVLLLMDSDSRILITYRGANDLLGIDDIPCNQGKSFYHFASVNPELVLAFIERCKEHVYSYDPGGWIFVNPYGVIELSEYVHILHVNRIEFLNLQERTKIDVTELQRIKGVPEIITVKRGDEGAFLYWDGRKYSGHLETSVQIIDTTGAGDAFDAAFNMFYIETGNPLIALKHAIAAGTLKITRIGSSSMPHRNEVSDLAGKVYVSRINSS
ncbi:MAG: PfkB family carbohydrate kinase [Desulfurococcales archaeon]|nr:PfkB family carbohydrate kinase [Desulfurococcales archaeon]